MYDILFSPFSLDERSSLGYTMILTPLRKSRLSVLPKPHPLPLKKVFDVACFYQGNRPASNVIGLAAPPIKLDLKVLSLLPFLVHSPRPSNHLPYHLVPLPLTYIGILTRFTDRFSYPDAYLRFKKTIALLF